MASTNDPASDDDATGRIGSDTGRDAPESDRARYDGSLPSPELLRSYEALAPGSANRILQLAEKHLEAQYADELKAHAFAERELEFNRRSELSSQIIGAILSAFTISVGAYLVLFASNTAASAIFVASATLPSAAQLLYVLWSRFNAVRRSKQ